MDVGTEAICEHSFSSVWTVHYHIDDEAVDHKVCHRSVRIKLARRQKRILPLKKKITSGFILEEEEFYIAVAWVKLKTYLYLLECICTEGVAKANINMETCTYIANIFL